LIEKYGYHDRCPKAKWWFKFHSSAQGRLGVPPPSCPGRFYFFREPPIRGTAFNFFPHSFSIFPLVTESLGKIHGLSGWDPSDVKSPPRVSLFRVAPLAFLGHRVENSPVALLFSDETCSRPARGDTRLLLTSSKHPSPRASRSR